MTDVANAYAGVIAELEARIKALDSERESLVAAVRTLRSIAGIQPRLVRATSESMGQTRQMILEELAREEPQTAKMLQAKIPGVKTVSMHCCQMRDLGLLRSELIPERGRGAWYSRRAMPESD